MQAPTQLADVKQIVDFLWYWGKIVFALGSFTAACILGSSKVKWLINEVVLLRKVIQDGFDKVGTRIDALEDCDAAHNTRISVLEDRDTRRRGDRRLRESGGG